jgi:outer membrane protein assembly factor BamB
MRSLIAFSVLLAHVVSQAGSAPVAIWRVEGEGHGPPASDLSTAYFLTKRHEVIAVDAERGTIRWRQHTGEPGPSTEGSAVVVAGSVLVAGDYNLVAFDRSTGAFRWRFVPAVGYAPGIYLGAATRGLVFAGSPAGRLYALRSSSGEQAWNAVVSADGRTTVYQPAAEGTAVAAGFTTFARPNVGGVVLFEPATGRERWRTMFPRPKDPLLGSGSAGNPIFAGDLVLASSGDGTVYALDRDNGSIRWTLPPIAEAPPILQGPVPAPPGSGPDYRPLARNRQLLFVGSLKGHVIAYHLDTRREAWRYLDDRSGSVAFAMASDETSVYVPFYSGRQVALDAASGIERWRTPDADAGFLWPAASMDDRVFLAGARGGLVAFRR